MRTRYRPTEPPDSVKYLAEAIRQVRLSIASAMQTIDNVMASIDALTLSVKTHEQRLRMLEERERARDFPQARSHD